MSVLILADAVDPSADQMVRALADRGAEVHRIDTAWFPGALGLDARFHGGRWVGALRTPRGATDLEAIHAVWYRTPGAFRLPETLSPAEQRHIRIEGKYGLGGVLLSLPVRWVNRPDLSATACYKPLQLAAAARAGLAVPDTLVTNTADPVREFANSGRMVTKMLAASGINEDGKRRVAYTREVHTGALADLDGIESTTHLFQERVEKAFDARVVVVGRRLFGFAMHGGPLDFRAGYAQLSYEQVDPPAEVDAGLRALMADLGLLYAAVDFVVDQATGRWVFIGDVNPGGQYGWLEAATGAPLTGTLAELLTEGKRPDVGTGDSRALGAIGQPTG